MSLSARLKRPVTGNPTRRLLQQPGDVRSTFADISAAKRDFGFAPKTELKDGISDFVSWHKDWKKQTLRVFRRRDNAAGLVFLYPVCFRPFPAHHIDKLFGNIGDVITHPFDIFSHEHHMHTA